jgi:hypothetical protein
VLPPKSRFIEPSRIDGFVKQEIADGRYVAIQNAVKERAICSTAATCQTLCKTRRSLVIPEGNMTYTTPILLTGDEIAAISGQPTNQGNPGDVNYGMRMNDVTALGGPTDVYRLVWFQNINTTDTFFKNGQAWQLQQFTGTGDPTTDTVNWATVPGYSNLGPRDDLVSGVGGGDEYIVFSAGSNFLLYNINGGLPTTPTQARSRSRMFASAIW